MFKYHLLALLLGTILDYTFGRIYSIWNPFDSIKRLVKFLDRALLGDEIILLEPEKQRSLGMWLIILVLLPVFAITAFFLLLCYDIAPFLGILFEAFATYLCLDGKYLYCGAKGVMLAFYGRGISEMKSSFENLAGVKADSDSEEDLTKNVITYIANETSDSLISPIVFMFLFGPVAGFLWRSLDILDSIIGHKTKRYEFFGYYTARLSWYINWIPSRFAGYLTVFAAKYTFGDFNWKNARYIHLRDRNKAISAFAGALNISLKNDTIGNNEKEARAKDIRTAINLMRNDFILIQMILVILLLIF